MHWRKKEDHSIVLHIGVQRVWGKTILPNQLPPKDSLLKHTLIFHGNKPTCLPLLHMNSILTLRTLFPFFLTTISYSTEEGKWGFCPLPLSLSLSAIPLLFWLLWWNSSYCHSLLRWNRYDVLVYYISMSLSIYNILEIFIK